MAKARKTTSPAITDGEQRLAGMKSIDEALDLDNGVSVATGEKLLTDTRKLLADYNASLAISDGLLTAFEIKEKELQKFNSKVLPAVGLKYGKDSAEYEKAGGVRDSERKKPVRKSKT
jgi:hypothetical protein